MGVREKHGEISGLFVGVTIETHRLQQCLLRRLAFLLFQALGFDFLPKLRGSGHRGQIIVAGFWIPRGFPPGRLTPRRLAFLCAFGCLLDRFSGRFFGRFFGRILPGFALFGFLGRSL